MSEKDKLDHIYNLFLEGAAICTDSRNVEPGCIFFALKGDNFNGNLFAKSALNQGASIAVLDEHPEGLLPDTYVVVGDVLKFLQDLANHHRKNFDIPVLGITGSNGKTTTKELINIVLLNKYKTLCTKGNLNNHIGVPLTLLQLKHHHQIAVIEMGANHQAEIALLCSIAEPTHVLITNVGKAHLEGFGGFEGVKKGKGEMYNWARENNCVVFIDKDNEHLMSMIGNYDNLITYGSNSDARYHGLVVPGGETLTIEWQSQGTRHLIGTSLAGDYNLSNIMSAVAVGSYFGVDEPAICRAVSSYVPDNQRSQIIRKEKFTLVVDAYNANPSSMEAALNNFEKHFHEPRAVILGEMLELGDESDSEHERIAALAQSGKFNRVLLCGEKFKPYKSENTNWHPGSAEASGEISRLNWDGYSILIKGSRGMKMEKVSNTFDSL